MIVQARLVTTTIVLVLLPPLALLLGGRPLAPHFRLPPGYEYQTGGAFSPLGAGLVGLTAGALILLAIWLLSRRESKSPLSPEHASHRRMPGRGWAGLALIIVGTVSGMIVSAPLSASLTLLGATLLLDADAWRRRGSSLMSARSGYFLMLFPAGIALGWGVEYLNRFVEIGSIEPGYGRWGYAVSVSLPAAALLPTVLAARLWLGSFALFSRIRPLTVPHVPHETLGLVLMLLSVAGLGAGTLWPESLYLLAWMAPVALLAGVQRLLGNGQSQEGLNGRALTAMGGGVLAGAVFALASAMGAPWHLHSPVASYPALGTGLLAAVLFAFYGLTAQQVGDWLTQPWRGTRRPLRRIAIPIRGEVKR
jgi:hypothetical protein